MTRPVRVARVAAIFMYPVKSMGGESLSEASVGIQGVSGDRLWALRDEADDKLTNAKRLPALLGCRARYLGETSDEADGPHVEITLPDGSRLVSSDPRTSSRLSEFVGRAVRLSRLPAASNARYFRTPPLTPADVRQMFGLAEADPLPDLSSFPLTKLHELSVNATMPGTHFDAYPVHLLTTDTLSALSRSAPETNFDVRRFRPNLLLESVGVGGDEPEREWCGSQLRCGELVLDVEIPTVRCSMPSRAQEGLEADPGVMRTIARERDRHLGVYCHVARAGSVRQGDEVWLHPAKLSKASRWAAKQARAARRLLLRSLYS